MNLKEPISLNSIPFIPASLKALISRADIYVFLAILYVY